MKVMIVSHSPYLHGAERSLVDLLIHLPPHIQIEVIVPRKGPLSRFLTTHKIPFHIVWFWGWLAMRPNILRASIAKVINFFAVHRITVLCKKHGSELIYTNTVATDVGARASLKAKRPHVWHIREFAGVPTAAQFLFGNKQCLTLIERTAAGVIFNSSAVRASFNRLLPNLEAEVIYNGIEIPENISSRLTPALPTFLIAGTIRSHKNQVEVFKAGQLLAEKGIAHTLLFAGDDSSKYATILKEEILHSHPLCKVTFTGEVPYLAPLFAASTALVLPSLAEPWGRVVAEAAAAGCPIIATRVGGVPEIITHQETGLLYEPGDITALAACMQYIITEPEQTLLRAQKAQAFVRAHLSMQQYTTSIEALLEKTIRGGQ